MNSLIEEAKKLISIRSESTQGNEELANYVYSLMKEIGLKAQLQLVTHSLEGVSKRQFNVIGILGDPLVDRKIRKGLLLNTHLDTVSPGLAGNWTETGGDPFAATIKDGKIYGLGSADVKIDFLCKLFALSKFIEFERKLKMPIYLVGTCGEELSMFGARYLIKSGALNPKFVMVGEPSELKVVYAHKCLNTFTVSIGFHQVERDARGFSRRVDLRSLGKAAHAAYPHLGTNAILQVFDFIKIAVDAGFEFRFTNVGGGDATNKVADSATIQFYLSSHQFEDFKRFFRDYQDEKGLQSAFHADMSGVTDSGVRLLPEGVYPCLSGVLGFFKGMSRDFEKVSDATYNPAHSTINLGKIEQGAGSIQLHFDMRLLPDLDPESIAQHISEGIERIGSQFPLLNVAVSRDRGTPGLNMTMEHELVQLCKQAMQASGIETRFDKKATATEAAQYFQAGYQAVIFGPGLSHGNSHSPNEHNRLDQIERATLFYEKLIERACL